MKKAVALKYDKERKDAPHVVAKGQGTMALKILEIAQSEGLAIKKDADLIELLSKLDIEQEIPPKMYKAVAQIFSTIHQICNDKTQT